MNRISYILLLVLGLVLVGCQQEAEQTEAPAEPAQATEATASVDIHTQEITYQVGDESFNGFLAYDPSQEGRRPGIIVAHEWWGHNQYVRNRAEQLAKLGYVALALDMYGDGKNTDHPDQAKEFMQALTADMDVAMARFSAAVDLLKDQDQTDPEKVAAIGYCLGGSMVLNAARSGADLTAVASFHGALATPLQAEPGAVKAKVLVFHGAADPFVPQEQVDGFKAEMETIQADYEFVNYENVTHSFTNPNADLLGEQFNLPLAYDAFADKDSWQQMLEAFAALFDSEPSS